MLEKISLKLCGWSQRAYVRNKMTNQNAVSILWIYVEIDFVLDLLDFSPLEPLPKRRRRRYRN